MAKETDVQEALAAIGINNTEATTALVSFGVCNAADLYKLTPSDVEVMQKELGLKILSARKILLAIEVSNFAAWPHSIPRSR